MHHTGELRAGLRPRPGAGARPRRRRQPVCPGGPLSVHHERADGGDLPESIAEPGGQGVGHLAGRAPSACTSEAPASSRRAANSRTLTILGTSSAPSRLKPTEGDAERISCPRS